MNYGEKENRRVKSQIVEGLFELMADYDYHEITITQIIQTARVARASYYRNFYNKEDIVYYYLRSLLEQLPERTPIPNQDEELKARFIDSLKLAQQEKDKFLRLHQNGLGHLIQATMLEATSDILPPVTLDQPDIYKLYFINGATYYLLMAWLERDVTESPEEVAELAMHYLKKGVLP